MTSFKLLKIDNSKKAAINRGKWKNPGAALYDQLLNSCFIKGKVPVDADGMKKAIKNGDYKDWSYFIKEAYAVAPVDKISNSPHGVTPFSKSGCKYPHHVLNGDKLVVSIPGLRAAYICARNQGVLVNHTPENKAIVAHFNRHFRELGLKPVWHHGEFYLMESHEVRIEENFDFINRVLYEQAGINLFSEENVQTEYVSEAVIEGPDDHPVLTSDFNREVGEKTPEALYDWMHENIEYDNTIHGWKLREAAQLYIDKKGNCHDQAYFEALVLNSWGYDARIMFFVEYKLDSDAGGNTHSLCYYRTREPGSKYYWFENAWEDWTGIHGPYDTVNDIKNAVLNTYNEDNNINYHKFDGIVFSTRSNFRPGMGLGEYVESWPLEDDHLFKKDVDKRAEEINEVMNWIDQYVHDDAFRESVDEKKSLGGLTPAEIKELDKKHSEKLVPIYGIIKSYSREKLRNDGTEKIDSELNSVKFDKIIHALTRGDNYSHALVSFDDTLTHMYSFEDEGFVEDNIETNLSWMGTKSIYICVMFVRESEKRDMEKFVKNLKDHQGETKYASLNLLKAFVDRPIKDDKRFVCSSFTGFIMSCANPKNLHRDYSRLRPEDITVLPRTFYLMNCKDAADFKARHQELQDKVKNILEEYKDEIDDYNNHLPRLLLQNRVDKLKTLDKILDWIIYKM